MSKSFAFLKMHGAGNHFVVVDQAAGARDWARQAPSLCAHHTGIGADGLLVIGRSEIADTRMRMYNPDGTEDMCGNGLRCAVRYAHERGWVGKSMTVQTIAGVRRGTVIASGEPYLVRVEMGRPSFRAADLPALIPQEEFRDFPLEAAGCRVRASAVFVGTPHLVVFDQRPKTDAQWHRVSSALETSSLFLERTSVCWAEVIDRRHVAVRIWERSVGETLACGTGACAVAAVGLREGLLGHETTIHMRGGDLDVAADAEGILWLSGPAAVVYRGSWP